jgi:ADP-ribosylglycohydrolase
MEPNTKEKFIGCIYGLAIGDALGYPVEFVSLSQIRRILGEQGVTGFESLENPEIAENTGHPIGSYSDDTQMSMATAKGLIESKTNDLDELMGNISKEYVAWAASPENNRSPGSTCMAGIKNLKNGKSWKDSGVPGGEGCGAAMRTAPIGLCYYDGIHRLAEVAKAASECTHGDKTASAAGVGTAYLVAQAIRAYKPEEILANFAEFSRTLDAKLNKKIDQVRQVLDYKNSEKAIQELGEGWKGDEALALGLYCFMKHPYDFKKAVLMGVNTNGDSDSIACITGAISGAYNGVNRIPQEWINKVENKELLKQTAEELYKKVKDRKEQGL